MGGPPLRGRPGPEGCAPHTLFLRGFDWEESKTTLNLQRVSGPTPRILGLADQQPLGVKQPSHAPSR